MGSDIKIGIIGDYDGRPSHLATEEAIKHCASKFGVECEAIWLPTEELKQESEMRLQVFDGLWCAPGSPYRSAFGAICAIRYARENDIPFLGTCGGFQHAALEYAKNVQKVKELNDSEFDPYSPNLFISALTCSLTAQSRRIQLDQASVVYNIYQSSEIEEKYNCSFGLNKEFEIGLKQNGLQIPGTDEEGEARILALNEKRFYIATLFQPQLSSTCENPHPLITAFLSHAKMYHNDRSKESNLSYLF